MSKLAIVGSVLRDKSRKEQSPEPEFARSAGVAPATSRLPIRQDGIGKSGPYKMLELGEESIAPDSGIKQHTGLQNPTCASYSPELPPMSSHGPDTGGISGSDND